MAGRPPLPIGSHGKITTRKFGKGYLAQCRHRDHDGVTRKVTATGATSGAATRALQNALVGRHVGSGGELLPDTRLSIAAEQWFEQVQSSADHGERSPNTVAAYRRILDCHVIPALGQLKLREVTPGKVDRFLRAVRDNSGAATARSCRSVTSGVLGLAKRAEAVITNAAKDTIVLSGKARKLPRALTQDERARWLEQICADPQSVSKDLPDLVSFMLASGVRIGEALAVSWDLVDLEASTVEIRYTIVRIKGQGLLRKTTKTDAGQRTLPLPPSIVAMLRRRRRAGRIGTTPVFPDSIGGWRDPTNTSRDLRNARGTEEFAWVTSHVFRKTAATVMDEAGMSARDIANILGHSRVSLTLDYYMGRGAPDRRAAEVLGEANFEISGE